MKLERPKERIHPKAMKAWVINGSIKSVIEWGVVIAYFFIRNNFETLPQFILII